jgi:hypothetical protein
MTHTRIAASAPADKVLDPGEAGGAPGVVEVARIAALADPALRNLSITWCYARLSAAVAARLPGGANWCTFATWASRQAGRTIRREDLEDALGRAVDRWLGDGAVDEVARAVQALGASATVAAIRQAVRDALLGGEVIDRASDAVARGNLKVFDEIGREFARFLALWHDGGPPDAPALEAFVAGLRPGDPPNGQEYLRRAFTHYHDALPEPDPASRAQRMLLANLEIGFHEQTRLQPEIAEALEAGVLEASDVTPRILAALLPANGIIPRVRRFFTRLFGGRTPLDRAVDALVAAAKHEVRAALTDHVMSLDLAGTRLRLRDDVREGFPPELVTLREPALLELLARIDPTPDSPRESGARDWADLPDRIHFIADMFRCYHARADLFAPPFTADQIAVIGRGQRPTGPL